MDDDLEAVRPLVFRMARKYCAHHMPLEDMQQELWINVLRMRQLFDPSRGVPWLKFVAGRLRNCCIDIHRTHGPVTRRGKLRTIDVTVLSEMQREDPASGRVFGIQSIDAHGCDGPDAVEWADLINRTATESPSVRALVLHWSGLTLREIGLLYGVCKSRVQQIISSDRVHAMARIRQLVAGHSLVIPQLQQGDDSE